MARPQNLWSLSREHDTSLAVFCKSMWRTRVQRRCPRRTGVFKRRTGAKGASPWSGRCNQSEPRQERLDPTKEPFNRLYRGARINIISGTTDSHPWLLSIAAARLIRPQRRHACCRFLHPPSSAGAGNAINTLGKWPAFVSSNRQIATIASHAPEPPDPRAADR